MYIGTVEYHRWSSANHCQIMVKRHDRASILWAFHPLSSSITNAVSAQLGEVRSFQAHPRILRVPSTVSNALNDIGVLADIEL